MISRRRLLHAGLAASVFPWTKAFGQTEAAPKLVLLMQSNGTHRPSFWPRGPGLEATPVLAPLVNDPALRARTTVIRGLYNHGGGMGNEHDVGFASLWTGKPTIGTPTDPWANGPSIDQQLNRALAPQEPYPTLNTGVLATTGALFKPHRWSFSYTAPRQQIPAEIDPWKLYARFFAPSMSTAEATQKLAQGKSVLDFVRADLSALRRKLPASELSKLDIHEAALRAHENRLTRLLDHPTVTVACRRPQLVAAPVALADESHVGLLVDAMFELIPLALSCGLTRIVNFQFGQCGERWRFAWLGLDVNMHDDYAHRDDGSDPNVGPVLTTVNRWYGEKVAGLCRAMHALPGAVAGQSLLDDSLVVWANEMGVGTHVLDDLPVVMVGRAAGRLPMGDRFVSQGPQTYERLGTSVLNLMGVPAEGFGGAPSCGPIAGL
jgi:hypothetical protein